MDAHTNAAQQTYIAPERLTLTDANREALFQLAFAEVFPKVLERQQIEIAKNVSHDTKTPCALINTSLYFFERMIPDDVNVRELTGKAGWFVDQINGYFDLVRDKAFANEDQVYTDSLQYVAATTREFDQIVDTVANDETRGFAVIGNRGFHEYDMNFADLPPAAVDIIAAEARDLIEGEEENSYRAVSLLDEQSESIGKSAEMLYVNGEVLVMVKPQNLPEPEHSVVDIAVSNQLAKRIVAGELTHDDFVRFNMRDLTRRAEIAAHKELPDVSVNTPEYQDMYNQKLEEIAEEIRTREYQDVTCLDELEVLMSKLETALQSIEVDDERLIEKKGKIQHAIEKYKTLFASYRSFGEAMNRPASVETVLAEDFYNMAMDIDEQIDAAVDDSVFGQNISVDIAEATQELIDNAVLATSDLGDNGLVSLAVGLEDGRIKIQVEDNGKPIQEEQIDKVFDATYDVDSSGVTLRAGLGLAKAWELVKKHNGEISATVRQNGVKVFTILLPVS